MAEDGTEQVVLRLSPSDAAILAAALRQYEPHWRPEEPGHGEELSALVRDITRLLAELRSRQPAGPPGGPGTPQAA